MTSFSRISLYDKCAHSYELSNKYPVEITFPMRSGIEAHKVLQTYGNHCAKHNRETDFEFFDKLIDDLESSDVDLAFDVLSAVSKVKESLHISNTSKFELEFAIDSNFNLIPFDSTKHFFRGVIDWVDFVSPRSAILTDFKTGWKMAAPKLQLMLYASMLMLVMPKLEHVKTRWYYTRRNKFVDGPELTKDEIYSVCELLTEKLNKINSAKEYPPTIAMDTCPQCGSRPYCRYFKEYVETFNNIDFTKNPELLYNQWKFMESLAKDLQKKVKALADSIGFIKVGDQRFTRKLVSAGLRPKKGVKSSQILLPFTQVEGFSLTAAIDRIELTGAQCKDIVSYAKDSPELMVKLMSLLENKTRNEYKLISGVTTDEEDVENVENIN